MNQASRKMAVSGMMVALGAAVMLLGGVIPVATFCCPAIAGLMLLPPVFDCGKTHAWSAWAAIALLSLMLCPDKEAALLFCFLGYYPILKWTMDVKIKKPWLRRIAKLGLWNVAIGVMYALIFFVLKLDQVLRDYREMGMAMAGVTLLIGNLTLILYDFALVRFALVYIKRLRPILFKK